MSVVDQKSKSYRPEEPLLSIVIPSYNRPGRLRNCLASIAKLAGRDRCVQTIVVNDGSTTSYRRVVDAFSEELDLVYCEQTNQGPATARNHGAGYARGAFLVFLDDDCTLPPGWLQEVQATLHPDCVVGGHTINCLPDNVFSQASQVLIDYLYQYYNHDHEQAVFITSNNLIIPRHIYEALGGFDLDFSDAAAEDRDVCDRLLHHGYHIKYRPRIVINHFHTMYLKTYFRQHFKYGHSAHLYHQKRKQRSLERLSIEPFSFYCRLLVYPYRARSPRASTISLLLFISQFANALGFWKAKCFTRSKDKA